MKYFIPLIIIVLTTFSCTNSEEINLNEFEQNQIKTVLKLSGQSQKNAYIMLDSNLKHNIWVETLNQNKSELNKEQIILVDKLLDIIEPAYFNQSNTTESKYSEHINNWLKESSVLFDKEEFAVTFTNLRRYIEGQEEEKEKCSCNTSEDYCWWSMNCTSLDCQSYAIGCGFLWNSECNGMCN